MKILMTGATGFVGKNLGIHLVREGHQLRCLVRNATKAKLNLPFPCEVVDWDGKSELTEKHLAGVETIIHLAGESIADGRWTKARKEKIIKSRIDTSALIVDGVLKFGSQVKSVFSASAVGYYGDTEDRIVNEDSPAGDGFLAEVCKKWELSLVPLKGRCRVVPLRIGVVLGQDGGVLEKLRPLFNLHSGSVLGSGRQWMSWIHLDDLCRAISFLVEKSEIEGSVNLVSPNAVTNQEFTRVLAETLHRGTFLPVPKIGLIAILGEMSQMVLQGQRVEPKKLTDHNFEFLNSDLQFALKNIFPNHMANDDWYIQKQWLPFDREIVWRFFSDETNLQKLTPEWLDFKILGTSDRVLKENTLIDYSLKIRGVPVKWRTLIEEWDPETKFVDRQLKGPYQEWHHTHLFESLGGGTLMVDKVRYRLPFGFLGLLGGSAIVQKEVKTIFSFRQKVMAKLNLATEPRR